MCVKRYEWTVLNDIFLESIIRTMDCQQVAYMWTITTMAMVDRGVSGPTLANYNLPGESLLESLDLTCYGQNSTRSTLEAGTICPGSDDCRAITLHDHLCEYPSDPVLRPSQPWVWRQSFLRVQTMPLASKHLNTPISSEVYFNAPFKQFYC